MTPMFMVDMIQSVLKIGKEFDTEAASESLLVLLNAPPLGAFNSIIIGDAM